jgi:4-amino-4-deoxy-L-arabinose transferase-like glycosyltransferase
VTEVGLAPSNPIRRRQALGAPTIAWLGLTLLITVAFCRLAGHNLANYRPLSNDEGELMAVGYKLATVGVLGSDMYAGFYGGDQHHFETLPLQHVLQAISFRLLGPGVLQARLVSLSAAVTLIWVVGWLAFRSFGLGAAVLGQLLLVAWRSNLTAASDGLPLLGVARTARYDVLGVAMVWLALAALDVTLRRPSRWRGVATGVFCGLAALSQFFGISALPLVLGMWFLVRGRAWRHPALLWIVSGFMLVVIPFGMYALVHFGDVVGQLGVYGERGDILRPGFWLDNARGEPSRYTALVAYWPPAVNIFGGELSPYALSPWLLVVGLAPAVACVAWCARKPAATGDRLLLAGLVAFAGLLLLLDQTKTPVYAILLLPSVCVALAVASVRSAVWVLRHVPAAWGRVSIVGLVAAIGACVALESAHAYQVDWVEASSVTPYAPLGMQIDAAIPPGAAVLGPERWWWALHDHHRYVSLRSIWFQWVAASAAGQSPHFTEWLVSSQAESIVVNINVRADVRAFPAELQNQFWTFIDRCTTLTADVANANYFETQVYAVDGDCDASQP